MAAPALAHGGEEHATKEEAAAHLKAVPEDGKTGRNNYVPVAPQGGVPKDLADKVGIDQKMDAQVPLDLKFKDENGQSVTLGQYFTGKPMMLTMLQYTCTQVCSAELEALSASLNDLKFTAGKEFDMVTVSIDPTETPAIAGAVKAEQLQKYPRPEAKKGWHFLSGDEKSIKALAASVGFKYVYDAPNKQYIHPDGVILLTPQGHVSRYFMQLQYAPQDLRFGLMEASKNQIGDVLDRFALQCFHYNPITGRYSFQIMAVLRFIAIAVVLGGLGAIWLMVRREKKDGTGKSGGAPVLKEA